MRFPPLALPLEKAPIAHVLNHNVPPVQPRREHGKRPEAGILHAQGDDGRVRSKIQTIEEVRTVVSNKDARPLHIKLINELIRQVPAKLYNLE